MWDLRKRRHFQEIDLGAEHQMALELRPAHDPTKAYGFVCTVISTKDLSAGIWLWHREGGNGKWAARKVIEIPAEPADPDLLPPPLKQFKAGAAAGPRDRAQPRRQVSLRFMLGHRRTQAVRRERPIPSAPDRLGRIGGMAARTPHPKAGKVNGAPQMLEVSRDGRRIYVTNSLYSALDEQFYPEGIRGWIAKVDVNPAGGIALDPNFFIPFEGERPHQIHLEGGDCSSDSFCYP